MKKILIATKNQAKIKEIQYGLKEIKNEKITILTLNDIIKSREVLQSPLETGKTFRQNAKIKAKYYGDFFNLPTLADDGGLLIPYLNNEPGVRSRRWLGYEATDQELIDYTLKKLKNQPKKNRLAYLETCLCFYYPEKRKYFFAQEKIKGYIAEKPSKNKTNGYPFRALFIVSQFNKYYDELTKEEHEKINHRLKALKKLVKIIKNLL